MQVPYEKLIIVLEGDSFSNADGEQFPPWLEQFLRGCCDAVEDRWRKRGEGVLALDIHLAGTELAFLVSYPVNIGFSIDTYWSGAPGWEVATAHAHKALDVPAPPDVVAWCNREIEILREREGI